MKHESDVGPDRQTSSSDLSIPEDHYLFHLPILVFFPLHPLTLLFRYTNRNLYTRFSSTLGKMGENSPEA